MHVDRGACGFIVKHCMSVRLAKWWWVVGAAAVLLTFMVEMTQADTGGTTHIVVPCYNEEKRLPTHAFLQFTSDQAKKVHFTFVNDGSTDGTLRVIENLASQRPSKISVHHLSKNVGKAEAVRKGMLHVLNNNNLTEKDFIAFWDADLATPLSAVAQFSEKLVQMPHVEMVFGARVALLGRDIQRKFSRHYLGRIFATLASIVLNLRIYDTQCGAKMFRATSDLRDALSSPFTTGWIFDVELIARFKNLRLRDATKPPCENVIYELPLESWHDIACSKLDFFSKIQALYGLGCIWCEYLGPFCSWNPVSATPPASAQLPPPSPQPTPLPVQGEF